MIILLNLGVPELNLGVPELNLGVPEEKLDVDSLLKPKKHLKRQGSGFSS